MAKETYDMAKETYDMAKETYDMTKETYDMAKAFNMLQPADTSSPAPLTEQLIFFSISLSPLSDAALKAVNMLQPADTLPPGHPPHSASPKALPSSSPTITPENHPQR